MNNEIRQLITVLNDALNANPTDLVALETIKAKASVALVRIGEFGNRLSALRAAYADDVDKLNAIPDPGAPVELSGLLDVADKTHQAQPVTAPAVVEVTAPVATITEPVIAAVIEKQVEPVPPAPVVQPPKPKVKKGK